MEYAITVNEMSKFAVIELTSPQVDQTVAQLTERWFVNDLSVYCHKYLRSVLSMSKARSV